MTDSEARRVPNLTISQIKNRGVKNPGFCEPVFYTSVFALVSCFTLISCGFAGLPPVCPFDWIRKRDRNALMRLDEKHRLTIKLFYEIKTGILFQNNIQRINPLIFAELFLLISHRYCRLPLPQSLFRFRMFCPIYFKYLLGAASNPQT